MSTTTLPDRGHTVLVVTTATLVCASVFVFGRLIGRIAVVKKVDWDDYFIILSWILAFGLSFSIDYGTTKGLGRHNVDIPESWLPALQRSEYAFSVLYNPALMTTKTSILIFYLRLSRNTQRLLRTASYVTLGLVCVSGVTLTFLSIFQCTPVAAAFDLSDGQCTALVTLYLASAPANILTDLAILVLPIPVLTGIQLPQRQKTALVVAFGLGIFVTIVDVVRIFYLQQASAYNGPKLSPPSGIGGELDFPWYASLSLMWSAVEVNIGIICACIPTLKPLITRIHPKLIFDHTQEDKFKSDSSERPMGAAHAVETAGEVPSSPERLIHPLPPLQAGGNQEQEIEMMEFLTTPGMNPQEIRGTYSDRARSTPAAENTVYFGFVNIGRGPKCMLEARGAESFRYCTLVTVLFFLWGFSYGLLNGLNIQISATSDSDTQQQTLGLLAAYFGAYFFGPLTVGRYVLDRGGFKACFITGLCIYGTGTLMFWPSAVLSCFPGFVGSTFVVGFGLSVLETAANPFLALCGSLDYAEMRLLLAQGVQAVGSVVSPVLAQKVLFVSIKDRPSLIDVQWAYLAITFFCVILAVSFYYMPLPEASDEELHLQCQPNIESSITCPSMRFFFNGCQIIYITLILGMASQFFYVGAQECLSVFFEQLVVSRASDTSSLTLTLFNYTATRHTTFAIGRFLASLLCLVLKPRRLLLFTYFSALLLSILITTVASFGNPNATAGMGIVLFFFEGPMWPLIFAISLRRLGRKTKAGAAYLTAAASGGASFPWAMYAVQRIGSEPAIKNSFFVVVALLAAGILFPIYLEAVPQARAQVDSNGDRVGRLRSSQDPGHAKHVERWETPIWHFSQRFGGFLSKPKKNVEDDLPTTEHRERRLPELSPEEGPGP